MNEKELNEAIAAKAYPKVTIEMINDAIEKVDFERFGTLTMCIITLRNGFKVTGESACIDPRNFDVTIGSTLAKKNAVDKIWALEGYAMAERIRMAAEAQRTHDEAQKVRNR